MPSKYRIIVEAAERETKEITSSVERYMSFLDTAAQNYKYSFQEQVLIHAQKPSATACAEIGTWNQLGRWVNKGTKGIALLVDRDIPYKLRYVFDVSDTNSRAGREITLWKMERRYEPAVMEALEDSFGEVEYKPDFPAFAAQIAEFVVEDNLSDYLTQLMGVKGGSLLEELDDLNTEVWLKNMLKSSIGYMILARCGYSPRSHYDEIDFQSIRDFDTTETISVLGTATSDISEMVLREIGATVRNLQREEQSKNRTFVDTAAHEYNGDRNQTERSNDDGNDLFDAGRLPDPRPDRSGEPEDWEIWNAAAQLPQRAQERPVHRDAPEWEAQLTPGGNRPEGERDDGSAHEQHGEGARRDGAAEGRRSDEVGRTDEQHSQFGGGNGPAGADLQLTEPLPTEEEQKETIAEAEAEQASAFVISQEDIDAILTRGSGVSQGKFRIYEQYLKKESHAENIEFLKNEYGWGGAYPAATVGGRKLDENHDGKGIKISTGSIMKPEAEILLPWKKVEKRIGELIAADRYLNRAEKEAYPAYRRAQEIRAERAEACKEIRSVIEYYNDFQSQLGNQAAMLNQYVLYDCVRQLQVGSKTTWTLTDNNFVLPLLREAMQTVVSENTHLTDRAQKALEILGLPLFAELEPNYDELNPPPEPEMEYRLSLGDTVYLGAQEYEILSLGDDAVVLYDPEYPLFNKELSRQDFDEKIKENPFNDKYRFPIEAQTEPVQKSLAERLVDFIRDYDFYGYQDSLEIGETDEDAALKVEADLSSETAVNGMITALTEFLEEAEDPGEAKQITQLLDELKGLTFAEKEIPEMPSDEELDQYPISTVEDGQVVTYPNAEALLDAQETSEALPEPPQTVRRDNVPHLLHPEILSGDRLNFRIERNDIGVGTPTDRYNHNVAAIRLLKQLEAEGRLATADEQAVLSEYVGWGGLAEVFDEKSSHFLELKGLLTEDEYAAARESTLTAYYTPPVVIKAMYQALENVGFQTGNILEPSCGIGNFMGLLPEGMSGSKVYGIELDSISGRIAQQLYQRNSIAVQGFEQTELPDSFFDCAIGNVPFGQFKVPDKRYDRFNFLIHDYFIARTIDKVRPGGVIAFVTAKGTMDKENPSVRKYIAQRADLLGAIRLPNDTFKSAAGTEVTSDILFFQKRDSLIDIEPDWVHLDTDANGIRMNHYFTHNPDMIMGEMQMVSGPHGPESACIPFGEQSLEELLAGAVQNIHGQMWDYELSDVTEEIEDKSIPADPTVRNFSFTLVDGTVYYRENSRMYPYELTATGESRVKGLIAIRDCVRQLIEYQTEDYPEQMIQGAQDRLGQLYDEFSKQYGLINSRANNTAFRMDSSYCLLSSLEVLDDEGNFVRKADMFSKRTIKQKVIVTSVDTASEALALSLAEKAKIDMDYMTSLTGKSEELLYADLRGVIFLNPMHTREDDLHPKYVPADEYLSGNVREKLAIARRSAELYPDDYAPNVEALEAVQPVDLSASEISVRLGATWLPPEDVADFMFTLFGTPRYCQWNIKVHYSEYTGEWNIEGKSYDRGNVRANSTYGTGRINGYKIIEETLNLKDVRIFDYVEDANGKKTAVLNKKETAIAQGKQELIKQAFADWIWSDPERRTRLTRMYNERFNSTRPREYDGSHLNFVGINPEITLRPHQVNAIAHILYGGNTLLAHVVGAGKTFEMVAAAMESKRLGLCQKSLFVVPNHLTEQWASEFLQLYPSANILVATKKDFEAKNRKRFCSRIATGDYDAVIIGHSQFEKIPMSLERQRAILQQQMDEVLDGISELKRNRGDNFSVKQLERTKKTIKQKLDKLNDQTRKDDVVTFEELGVDRIFVDEAHYYKNLAAFTKMRNVGGISQTEAMKSSDLYMKCRYLDELTGGKGVVFATGTPISNSMVEMYTMQKYLQYGALARNNLIHFDAWASTFGETVTAIELAPEGTGYRAKTRFAKFYNLPELMTLFKEVADVQTADMLRLPVPEAHYHSVVLKPSEQQKKMVESLSERAERVRNKMVDSSVDNMLLITNDGRKLALDQRLMNDMLPESETGKVAACAANVYEIWQKTSDRRSTQLVFCDLSTPHGDGKFNVYDALRDSLIAKGIPKEEIAYIHSANSEAQKKELFGKVRSGQIRVLIGSTQKMGAGTNVQAKLIALHHLDCPWRPSDLQQREGRIVRQGNENPEVDIFTYVTESTFDSYLYQLVESKQKFIGQIMTSKSPVRSAEDIDETALSYAEIKALCTGNPYIKEKMDLDIDVGRLKLLKANHLSQRYSLEDWLIKEFPQKIAALEQRIEGYQSDIERLAENTHPSEDGFCPMEIKGRVYTEKKEAGAAILDACQAMKSPDPIPLGSYRGFAMELSFDSFSREYKITLKGDLKHVTNLGSDVFGNILRLDNLLAAFPEHKQACMDQLDNTRTQMENARIEVQKPFPQEEELRQKSARLEELNILLNMDKAENEIIDGEQSEETPQQARSEKER